MARQWIPVEGVGPAPEGDWSGGWAGRRGDFAWELTLGTDAELPWIENAVTPPSVPDLALHLHELPELPAGALWLPGFHRAFPCRASGKGAPRIPTIATPEYLLARLQRLGARNVLATADEGELLLRAGEVFAGRGPACRFTVRRRPGPPAERPGPSAPAGGSFALHDLDPRIRARVLHAAPWTAVNRLLLGVELKKPAAAAQAFEAAIEIDPEYAAAHFELGKTKIQLDDLEGALQSFLRAADLLPEFASAWANAGAALGELERTEEALEPLERAAKLDPLNHSFVSNIGVTQRDLGWLEESEATFRRALALAPDFVFGTYNLANVVYLRGRHGEAVELFEDARERDPGKSSRQGLLLAVARLAAGDEEGALRMYAEVFDSLEGQMKLDMRTVAEWDLKGLARRMGVIPGFRQAAELVRSV